MANTTDTPASCYLYWDSYFHVSYTEQCEFNQLEELSIPSYGRYYSSIVLSVLGTFFNLWALILLVLDYHGSPVRSTSYSASTIANVKPDKKTSRGGTKKTTMQVGLIIFCLFEVLYHAASTAGESVTVFTWKQMENRLLSPPVNGRLTYIFTVLSPVSSVFAWFRDTGICGRNWAITLITIARAEVVLWPLASRKDQRCLRQKRVFLIVFCVFALTGVLISGLRRVDEKITVCYNKKLASHCVSSETFLLPDLKKFSAAYFTFQTFLPWLLILIFTTLIIIKLKPCKRQSENFIHRQNPCKRPGSRDNHLRASIAVTVLAVFCTIFECPTFAVSMYYIAFDPKQSLGFWDTLANTLLQIDSIANFFLLIITMPSLRRRLMKTLPSHRNRSQSREQNQTEMKTVIADTDLISTDAN